MLTRSILGGLNGKSYLQCLLITMLCIGLAIYALIIAIIVVFLTPAPKNVKADNDYGKRYGDIPIVVSMGDSYSSGEGIEEFYDQNLPVKDKVRSDDWLAHRSTKSWGGQIVLPTDTPTPKPTKSPKPTKASVNTSELVKEEIEYDLDGNEKTYKKLLLCILRGDGDILDKWEYEYNKKGLKVSANYYQKVYNEDTYKKMGEVKYKY